jgi:superfamily II DNA/RNA helicase
MGLTALGRQTMLFSATMPGAIVALARRYMTQPTHIRAMGDDTENAHTVKAVQQFVYRAHALDKVEMIAKILQAHDRGLTIIFSRTKRTAAKVADDLSERGFAAAPLHGDLGQGAREQALRAFRNGKIDVLVATDVAARGIDVENVTHVINYQCPEDEKTYVHRVGRTARAGNTGVAVTFVDWDDLHRWTLINKALDLGIPEPEETYSSSDHLFTDLGIPADAKGYLRRSEQTRAGLDAEQLEDLGETGKRHSKATGGRQGGRGQREDRGGADEPARARRTRNRRRTRGGGAASAAVDGTTAENAPAGGPSSSAGSSGEEPGARPRRRRRRGGQGRSTRESTGESSTD